MTARPIITAVEFDVEGDLIVGDPCYVDQDDAPEYDLIERGLALRIADAAGTWRAEIEMKDEGSWGNRVGELIVTRVGARASGATASTSVGVDSGQMFAGAASCLPLDYDALMEQKYPHGFDHTKPDNDAPLVPFAEGAVSHTGIGDGTYEVQTTMGDDGRPARVTVDFLPETDWRDEDDYADGDEDDDE